MQQLLGEYYCKIDEKGRIKLPNALILQLGRIDNTSLVINRGYEQYLNLYPLNFWEQRTAEFDKLRDYREPDRKFLRYFYRGAQRVEIDKSDRILINKSLLNYAKIDREIVLLAINQLIEVWSVENYNQMLADEPEDFSNYAEKILTSTELPH